jgi:hypothetical protein
MKQGNNPAIGFMVNLGALLQTCCDGEITVSDDGVY